MVWIIFGMERRALNPKRILIPTAASQVLARYYISTRGAFPWSICGAKLAVLALGLSVFLCDGDTVFRTYFTSGRSVEALGSNWTFLDLTPLGRQENWEVSPDGSPQTPPYEWWRRHDEYDA